MTLNDMLNLLSYQLDDPQFGYFTKPQLTFFLNNALIEVQKLLILSDENYYLQEVQTPVVQNQRLYLLPDDCLSINRVEVIQNPGTNQSRYPLEEITNNGQYQFSDFGQPYAYYLQKQSLVLVPTPNVVNFIIRMDYSYRVQPMVSDTDEPDVPTQYHEMIPCFAAVDCLLKDGRPAELWTGKINEWKTRLKETAVDRLKQSSRQVVVTSQDSFMPY